MSFSTDYYFALPICLINRSSDSRQSHSRQLFVVYLAMTEAEQDRYDQL